MKLLTGALFVISGVVLLVLYKIAIVDPAYTRLPNGAYPEVYGPVSFFRVPVYILCGLVILTGIVILLANWQAK